MKRIIAGRETILRRFYVKQGDGVHLNPFSRGMIMVQYEDRSDLTEKTF